MGQILVKIYAAGVNPSDTYVRLGPEGPYAKQPKLIPELPYTPGKDGAGVVEAVGEGVQGLEAGARVYTTASLTGTAAEYALCTPAQVFPLPQNVSFKQGACVGVPGATAFRALFIRCKAQAGDAVLVHGASGAVGLSAVQLAVGAGCKVIGTAGTEAGRDAVLAAGAMACVNHRNVAYLKDAAYALPKDKGEKFDIVLEMAAHTNLLADLGVIKTGGQLAIIGSKAQSVELNPRLIMPPEISIHGVFNNSATEDDKKMTHSGLYAAMERGDFSPVVGMELPLEEAPTAHKEVIEPSSGGKVGNIVLVVHNE